VQVIVFIAQHHALYAKSQFDAAAQWDSAGIRQLLSDVPNSGKFD
jgi:hypothetical protein